MNENPRVRLARRGLAVVLAIAAVGGAGSCVNKKEINTARSSVYDAEFAVVYSAAVSATRALYPTLDEDPTTGTIKTAWHQVKYTDPGGDDPKSVQARDRTANSGAASPQSGLGYNPSLARRITFIRFDVHVTGGRPWRVRVVGTASELEPGNALPTELRGQAKPHWLAGRNDALVVAIYRKLKNHATPAPVIVEEEPEELPKAAVGGDIPEGARAAAQAVVAAIDTRDYASLRRLCTDDVVWSLGAAPGVDGAMAMWQADPTTFVQMRAAVTAGCARAGADVVCPGTAARGAWQVRLTDRRGWRLAGFVQVD